MSFQRYKDYKDSGIEWVDKLPSCWKLAKLRWLATLYSGGTPDKEKLFFWENGTIPWLSSGAVNERIIDRPSTYITKEAFEDSSAKWIPEGAIVMALAGQGKTKGMVARMAISSTCNQSMAAIVPSSELYSSYLFWWLDSNYQNIRNMAGGDLRDGLNLELLGNIPCPLPQYAEQQSIAAFLDAETARIDSLIADYEALMALLREERQAAISHAVTKGLNPDVPMKDSGIEWLGEVPEHWDIWRLKRSIAYSKNGIWGNEPKEDENDIPCVRVADFNREKLRVILIEPTIRNVLASERIDRTLVRGDLIIEKSGGGEGQPVGCVVLYDDSRLAVCSNFTARIKIAQSMDSSFWRYAHAAAYAARINTKSIKQTSGIQNIDSSQYFDERFAFPPFPEQQAIAAFLDTETARIDSLIADAEKATELLRESRTALISDAVTGKIDVRDWQQENA